MPRNKKTSKGKLLQIAASVGSFGLFLARNYRIILAVAGFVGAGALAVAEKFQPVADAVAAAYPF